MNGTGRVIECGMGIPYHRDDLFGAHFEPEGDGFLYRRYPDEAPVRVSASERDTFVSELRKRTGRIIVATLTLIVLGGVAVLLVVKALGPGSLWLTIGPVAAIVIVCGWLTHRAATAPLAVLAFRKWRSERAG